MSDTLPTDAAKRKAIPVATGFVDYFPDAMAEVAQLSRIGNDQHNPGKPLHWDRSKSGDESDALMRHFLQRGTLDTDGVRHTTKVAWRAMAMLQKELEASRQSTNSQIDGATTLNSYNPLFHTNDESKRTCDTCRYPQGLSLMCAKCDEFATMANPFPMWEQHATLTP